MKISRLLKTIMNKLNLTQKQLSIKLKVSQSTISAWQSEHKLPSYASYKNLVKFCNFHDIKIEMEELFK